MARSSHERPESARPLSFARRFRRHAEWLAEQRRSPLNERLLTGAADDIEAGGRVADLVRGVDAPPGAVPQLRLLAALHELVLAGDAPALAEYYPSARGFRAPDGVWPAAAAVIDDHFEWIRRRMSLGVQTNEPGRSAVLFGALLWLTETYARPIRLLEIGASAGVNLLCDRYCYVVAGRELGDPSSPVRFEEPWVETPAADMQAAAAMLTIARRAGCDLAPLDPSRPDHRVRLLSYVWPDELKRIERARAALDLAAGSPQMVAAQPASTWLADELNGGSEGELTVVWHSVVRQYAGREEWAAVQEAIRNAMTPTVELAMEPSEEDFGRFELTVHPAPDSEARRLAWCNDHGPPVIWERWCDGPPHIRQR